MSRYQINPGEFRHIVSIQKKGKVKNSYGERIEDWIDYFKVRVAIYPVSGKELFAAEKVNNETTHKINMRYIPNKSITPDMRIKFGERIFDIISPPINFQEKNIELQIMCKEVF